MAAVLNPGPPPGLENYSALERLSLETSAAQLRQPRSDTQDSQDMLAGLVPGTRHGVATKSGHYIQLDQPRLVTRAIRDVVRAPAAADLGR